MEKGRQRGNVTIKDIACASGVSIATVSRVMNNISGRCSAETEVKIRQIAEKMGYVPNVMARSLVTQRSGLVAVLIPDIHYYYYQELYAGLEDYFKQYDIRPILCTTLQNMERERQYIQSMSNGLVDGMIIATLNGPENNEEILKLAEKGFPIVTLERYGSDLDNCCNVRGDNVMAGELAVDYLYENGHRRIAFICGPDDAKNSSLRYNGYMKGLEKHGLDFDTELVTGADYQFEKSVTATAKLLRKKEFTALIAANDLMCVGACNAIKAMKKSIPGDVSVIGLDHTAYMEVYHPILTSISFPGIKMGIRAGKCLKRLIDGKSLKQSEYIIAPALKTGESVQAAIKGN